MHTEHIWELADDLPEGQRYSTYADAQKLNKGPRPIPDWVVTDRAAIDTDLGVIKTGKEADCLLLDRSVPGGRGSLLAVKRYRTTEHTLFHRDPEYTDGRRTRRSRDTRALQKKTAYGREIASGQWAMAEWDALKRFWLAGLPVPYPVQLDGTEILMEYIEQDGAPAPRLAQTRPDSSTLASYFEQLRDVVITLAADGLAHGDLSPYNVLAQGDRVVVIDLPQIVDVVANPAGLDFLRRDCHNISAWFARRGLDVDEELLFFDAVSQIF